MAGATVSLSVLRTMHRETAQRSKRASAPPRRQVRKHDGPVEHRDWNATEACFQPGCRQMLAEDVADHEPNDADERSRTPPEALKPTIEEKLSPGRKPVGASPLVKLRVEAPAGAVLREKETLLVEEFGGKTVLRAVHRPERHAGELDRIAMARTCMLSYHGKSEIKGIIAEPENKTPPFLSLGRSVLRVMRSRRAALAEQPGVHPPTEPDVELS